MEPRRVLSPQWKQLYQAAILETDRSLLPRRIVAAESAIRSRLDELESNPDIVYEERDVLASARTMLACLRRMAEDGKALRKERRLGCQ